MIRTLGISLLLLQLYMRCGQVEGVCRDYNQLILNRWWQRYDGTKIIIQDFQESTQTIKDATTNAVQETYECQTSVELVPLTFSLRKQESTGEFTCLQIYVDIDGLILLQKSVITTVAHVSECQDVLSVASAPYSVLVQYNTPFNFEKGQCPSDLTRGHYLVELDERSSSDNICGPSKTHFVSIISDTDIEINLCSDAKDDAYAYPYSRKLTCLKSVAPFLLDSEDNNGNYLILAHEDDSKTRFYCAKYKTDVDLKIIEMSIDVSDEFETLCQPDMTTTSVSADQYRALKFSPSYCVDGTCDHLKNDDSGECTTDMTGVRMTFDCTCEAGWEGDTCDTNINDCVNVDCQNGGTCVDLLLDYRCDCVDPWGGRHCEIKPGPEPEPEPGFIETIPVNSEIEFHPHAGWTSVAHLEACNKDDEPLEISLLEQPRGSITSPGFNEGRFPQLVHCQWLIKNPDIQNIGLQFEYFYFGYHHGCEDYVDIYVAQVEEGQYTSRQGRYCADNHPHDILLDTKHSGDVLIHFHAGSSDVWWGRVGFNLTYFVHDQPLTDPVPKYPCQWEDPYQYYTNSPGQITSPGYGHVVYPPYSQCAWMISTSPGWIIRFWFTHVELDGSMPSCSTDSVVIYDGPDFGSPSLGRVCGFGTGLQPYVLKTTTNQAYVTFSANATITYSGFKLEFQPHPA